MRVTMYMIGLLQGGIVGFVLVALATCDHGPLLGTVFVLGLLGTVCCIAAAVTCPESRK